MGIRERWIREALRLPSADETAPMSRDEVRARVDALGGLTRTAQRLGVTYSAIKMWVQGSPPLPRNRALLRRATGTVEVHEIDDSPMSADELHRIIRALGGPGDASLAVGCHKITMHTWISGKAIPTNKYRARLRRAYYNALAMSDPKKPQDPQPQDPQPTPDDLPDVPPRV